MKKSALRLFALILLSGTLLAMKPDTLAFRPEKMKSPGLAIGMSMVFPGAGQMYNGKWVKGLVFLGAETGLGAAAYYYYRDHYVNGTAASLETAKPLTWFFAAVYVYSLMDAYVDAHLSAFPDDRLILEPDPATNGIKLSIAF
ncbi:MAG: hypothetical protein JXR21_05580 [Candidatus Marinimicrobia bacterium]|nr:hypothetical protein [Candidatus Neomarinimicrobiota bacterium]